MLCSIDCCLPCAFSLAAASSLTSLFDRHPAFLGFSGGSSPSSLSCRFCTCRFELETSCCTGGSESSIEGSSVSGSGKFPMSGGSRGKEGSVDGEGFCLEEGSPRISKELLLGGRLLCGGRAFLGGDFVAGACLVSASGWEPEGPARDPFFSSGVFFTHLLPTIFLGWGFGF
jgi:hypothetical protein